MSTGVPPDRYCPLCAAETNDRVCAHDGTATLLRGAPPSDPSRIQPGDVIADRYRIEGELGRGGFGAVFLARHTGTGQEVGLKVLVSGADDTVKQRFFREARMTAQLRHPNTIRVFDFGQSDDGTLFIAMELLRGTTVADELERRQRTGGTFSEDEAIEIGVAVADSLDEAHRAGLVHRDLKPHNLFLHDDARGGRVVKVLDFGIAKGLDKSLTGDGILGTPTYMSPEQIRNLQLDGRSDVYAVGVVLFYLVAGRPPFDADDALVVMMEHTTKPPPRLSDVAGSEVSAGFDAVIARCLAKDPRDRFQDAVELVRALRTVNRRDISGSHHPPKRLQSGKTAVEDNSELPQTVVGPIPTGSDEDETGPNAAPRPIAKPNWPLRIATFLGVSSVTAAIVVWSVLLGAKAPAERITQTARQTAIAPRPDAASTTETPAHASIDTETGNEPDAAAAIDTETGDGGPTNARTGQTQVDAATAADAGSTVADKPKPKVRRRSKRGRRRAPSRARGKPRKPRRHVIDDALEVEVN